MSDTAFSLSDVGPMLQDPVISMAVSELLIQFHACRVRIDCPVDEEVVRFIGQAFDVLMAGDCRKVAKVCLCYGYCPGEIVYGKGRQEQLRAMWLRCLEPRSVNPIVIGSKVRGFRTADGLLLSLTSQNQPATGFWIVHDEKADPVYGKSVLADAWETWREKVKAERECQVSFDRHGKGDFGKVERLNLKMHLEIVGVSLGEDGTVSEGEAEAYRERMAGKVEAFIRQVDGQVVRPLVRFNFGRDDYTVTFGERP